jgi:putative phosphoesterase
MISAVKMEKPDICFFLGDGERDVIRLQENFPDLPVYSVRGNCDFRTDLNKLLICNVEGVIIFATHGHLSNVKYEDDLRTLTYQAKEAGADIALFGHTHVPTLEYIEGGSVRGADRELVLFNPGSLADFEGSFGNLSLSDNAFLLSHGKYHNIKKKQ